MITFYPDVCMRKKSAHREAEMEEKLIEVLGYIAAAIVGGLGTLGAAVVAHFSLRTKTKSTADALFGERVDKKTVDLLDRLEKRVDVMEKREKIFDEKYEKLGKALQEEKEACDEKLEKLRMEFEGVKVRLTRQEEMSDPLPDR